MPSKIQLDENLWFLYICLQKSDLKSIDFTSVGQATNLKPPAARMRYTRLRRQIESGTLIGTHGTPFLSTTSPISTSGKRKRLAGEDEEEEGWKKEGEVKGEAERRGVKREKGGGEGKVKVENGDGDSGWQSGSETTGSEGWDSEDEVPLAKLRKGRLENSASASAAQQTLPPFQHPFPTIPTNGVNYGFGNGGGGGGGYSGQGVRSGATVPRYIPASEGRAWAGMIPVGNVGMGSSSGYPAYWGNGFQGIGAWEQGLQVPTQKPRKSV